ncbi:MAG: class I SAM-dependent rRNA methyltransferase [Candidatus Kapabacteria bacterium]|jgi:23S rRNA (cytosine1962-C5)-methyltransferase|nr:class I SAM-dependent rRNA methyltransferase [Candidatus Kapabacteria bacterium]
MTTLTVKNRHNSRLRGGHLWVFRDELEAIPPTLTTGEIVQIQSAGGHLYGSAIYHAKSQIAARLLASETNDLSADFFAERIKQALALRTRLFPNESTYRLVFGESDFLPGLIIDKYCDAQTQHDFFVLQTLSAGMDMRKNEICSALRSVFPATTAVIEKNNSALRKHDGLDQRESVLWGDVPPEMVMSENGVLSALSLMEGQKTGYFLDQKLNRLKIMEMASGLRVLDCFTNQGGFALHAAKGGAAHALGLDSSDAAIARCRINARLNGLETKAEFASEEVLDYLHHAAERFKQDGKRPWDMIILDPPAFAKAKQQVPQAKRGYAKINRMALRLLPRGGFLATGSCSHHVSEDILLGVIREEAERERRQLRLVFRGGQSPCHPVLSGMPETSYLKFLIFEVV